MKKWIASTLIVFALNQAAYAAQTHWKTIKINDTTAPSVLTIDLMPANPEQGQQVSALIQLTTTLSSPIPVNTLVSATLDISTQPLPLIHPSADVWIAQLGVFGQIASHTLNVSLVEQDTSAASTLQTSINSDKVSITSIQDQINNPANASNPAELALLNQQLQTAQAKLSADQASLAATLVTLNTENIPFSISAADPESSIYPQIAQITPNYGGTGSTIQIQGANFGSNENAVQVLINGLPALISSLSSSSIMVTVPAGLPSPGVYNVQVNINGANPTNAILNNGYFSLPGGSRASGPVAEFTPANSGTTGALFTLDGSLSYGGIGTLSYQWHFLSVPPGSSVANNPFGSTANPAQATFTPDIGGQYIVSLTVTDSASPANVSLPTYEIIQVGQPVGISFSNSNLTFAARIGSPMSPTSVTITNLSAVDAANLQQLTLTPQTVANDSLGSVSDFSIQNITLPVTIPPGQSVTFQIAYTPTETVTALTTYAYTLTASANDATVTTNPTATANLPLSANLYEPFPFVLTEYFQSVAPTPSSPGDPWVITNANSPTQQDITVPAFFDTSISATVQVQNTGVLAYTVPALLTLPVPNPEAYTATVAFQNVTPDANGNFIFGAGQIYNIVITVTPVTAGITELPEQMPLTWLTGIDGGFQSTVSPWVDVYRMGYMTFLYSPIISASAPAPFSTKIEWTPLSALSAQGGMLSQNQSNIYEVTNLTIAGPSASCFFLSTDANVYLGTLSGGQGAGAGTNANFTSAQNFDIEGPWIGSGYWLQTQYPNENGPFTINPITSNFLSCYTSTGSSASIQLNFAGYLNPIFIPILVQ